ncbi:MAG: nucleoside deaminase [Candidatus Dependentiae bacterium]|nr:nucleoside deaminase [Candidatus Dependentiae bacterium]
MTSNNFSEQDYHYMRLAIQKTHEGIAVGQSPFGACIVKDNNVIALEHNIVWRTIDITAHAEITAIRAACKAIQSISLAGAIIYSTCEPCPMCFSACHWAGISKIYYGTSIADAAVVGFRELEISNITMKQLSNSSIEIYPGLLKEESQKLFDEWFAKLSHKKY